MDNVFLALMLLSVVGFFVALFNPRLFKIKSRIHSFFIFGGLVILFFVLFGISPHTDTTTSTTPTHVASATPQNNQQKIETSVESLISDSASSWSSYKQLDIASSTKSLEDVTIDINTHDFWNGDSAMTSTGKLTSQIFQKVFPINTNFDTILVRYYGSIVDQYGNSKDSMLISYTMDRATYSKINWSGFSDVQNDYHLCAFLREQFNSLPQSEQDQFKIGCAVIPRDIRAAEDKIEIDNRAQYPHIPEYGN